LLVPLLGLLPDSRSPSFPPLPINTCMYHNTDDINMPESSSVGHNKCSGQKMPDS
jgi:hypothetical protein